MSDPATTRDGNGSDDYPWLKPLVYLAFTAVAFSVQPFTRRGFGRHYFGLQAAAVVPVVLLVAMVSTRSDATAMLSFLGAFLVACLLHRLSGFRYPSLLDAEHTRYDGYPWLAGRWLSEPFVKRAVEPLVVIAAGLAAAALSPALAVYLIAAGFLNAAFTVQRDAAFRVRTQRMNDRLIEQRRLARRLRELQGDEAGG